MSRPLPLLSFLAVACLLAILVALGVGDLETGPLTLWRVFTGETDATTRQIVLELRLPRALTAFVVGGMLALAGAQLQVLLGNPLADPYVLGTSGGAATGALLAMLLGATGLVLTFTALGGALFSILLVFGLSHGRGPWSGNRLLLTGVVIAAGWGALISFILSIAPQQNLPGMLFWLMGDLSHAANPYPGLVLLLALLLLALPFARNLNLLARGELQAAALGVSVLGLRRQIYISASLLTAVAVTLGGSIGFIGLIVPHLLRLVGGSDHRWLLPASVLGGGLLLVLADTLARTLFAPQQLPAGILTALIGVPLFLFLLQRGYRQ